MSPFNFCTHPYFIQSLLKRLYSYTYVNCFQKYNFTLCKNLDSDIKLPSFIIIINLYYTGGRSCFSSK